MTALIPKYSIVVPKESINYVCNPVPYLSLTGYTAYGAGVTIELSDEYSRRGGGKCIKVNTVPSINAGVFYDNVTTVSGQIYTASADVLVPVAGEPMTLAICNTGGIVLDRTDFISTGHWQRIAVTRTESTGAFRQIYLFRTSASSNSYPIYADGFQFEDGAEATTFFQGYSEGFGKIGEREFWWEGAPRESYSHRSGRTRAGGRLVDISQCANIAGVYGLGMGGVNHVMTELVSGGAMYQSHTRKPRNFSMTLNFSGADMETLHSNRETIIDAIRPDADDQPLKIIYQGFDDNGNEVTDPLEIICVSQDSLPDTPILPTSQTDILHFTVPDGHLRGAFYESKTLDLYEQFDNADFIMYRDRNGKWHEMPGLNEFVFTIAEAPDGDIYVGGGFTNAGGVADADYIAKWDGTQWKPVGIPLTGGAVIANVQTIAFDAKGHLYIGGDFTDFAGIANADYFAVWDGTAWAAYGSGINERVMAIEISPAGIIYIGGFFTSASGNADNKFISMYDPTTDTWKPLATGLIGTNSYVYTLAMSPTGILYIGGYFQKITGADFDRICKWDGTAFSELSGGVIDSYVQDIAFNDRGEAIIVGNFTHAGGTVVNRITRWMLQYSALGLGLNAIAYHVSCIKGEIYVGGSFDEAGGLPLRDHVAVYRNGAWLPIDIDFPTAATIYCVHGAQNGSIYFGGNFTGVAKTGKVAENIINSTGSAKTYPFVQIHGPGQVQSIVNYSTGRSVYFNGLVLQSGEWININFDPTHLYAQSSWAGRGSVMRYISPGSDLGDFYLKPGENAISLFMPTGTTIDTNAWIQWQPVYWSIDGAVHV